MLKDNVQAWLDQMEIENYTINDDLTVDVNGDVDLSFENLTEIPLQFGSVKGAFGCNSNHLTSLKGCPQTVGGSLNCYNNQLTSLEGGPQEVGGDFYCEDNPLGNFQNFDFKGGGKIFFTPTHDMDYFNEFKDKDGNIQIDFQLLKSIIKSRKIDEILNEELNENEIIKPQKNKI